MESQDDNPSDESVERSLKENRNYRDKRKNSIEPSFLENSGISENATRNDAIDEDFSELSSDKEEDTTEGEITDTHTAE
ncbi:MAG: hypothetical protein ACYCQJ_07650 [Nitrososphaerales archaeon]